MASPADVVARWPLVGRAREQGMLRRAQRDVGCRGALIVGEAGVGKTRLADEVQADPEHPGPPTFRVAATRASQSIPLGVFFGLLSTAPEGADGVADAVADAVEHLRRLGGDQRILLAVDDAHLLDPTSAVLVHQLALQGRAFVLLTVRLGETAPDPITALWKDDLVRRIDVGPLDHDQAEELLTRVLGGHVEGMTVHRLFEMSQGNPLYLRELVLGALDAGLLTFADDVWLLAGFPHSPRLTELVDARLADVTDDQRSLLELLAFAEPLPLPLADAVTSRATVDALDRRGLVRIAGTPDRAELLVSHPVVGEVLRADITTMRAASINRTLADAADGLAGIDPLRSASWRLDGGGEVETGQMLAAARRALFARDAGLAERLARAAWDAGGAVPAGLVLGESLLALGRHAEADEVAAALERAPASDADRAMLAMNRAETLFWGLGRPEDADAVIGRALGALPEGPWRDELLGFRAVNQLLTGHPLAAAASALPLLNRTSGRARVEAATVAGPALAVAGRTADAIRVATDAYEECVALGDQLALSDPGAHLVARAFAELEAGLVGDAAATAGRAYDEAIEERSLEGQAWGALLVSRVALVAGDLDQADRLAAEGARLFRAQGRDGTARWCLACRAWALASQGRGAAAGAALDDLDGLAVDHLRMMDVDVERARAWTVAVTDGAAAVSRLATAAERGRATGTLALAAGAYHDLVRLGRADLALDPLAELATQVDGELIGARLDHARAALDADPAGLEAAASAFDRIGARPLAAEAMAQASAAWRAAGRARNAERAAAAALERADQCAGRLATPALQLAGPPAALTDREREVATMAASGRTNREIAAHLGRSVRTIENHLQRAFDKLGVAGRADLADHLLVEAR